MEDKRKKIEQAVCDFYKVEPQEIYATRKSVFPYDVCKKVLMYHLFKNKVREYDIAPMFGVSTRIVSKNICEIKEAMKSETKVREDIEIIYSMLNE